MNRVPRSPVFDIEGFGTLTLHYDANDDIAYVHLGEPQPAESVEVDDGWYLRVDASEHIVGLELHALREVVLTDPALAAAFRPTVEELAERTNGHLLAQHDIDVQGASDEMPRTAHLAILLVGLAMAKHQALRRHLLAEAALP